MNFSKKLFTELKNQTIENIKDVKDTDIQKLFNALKLIKKKK